MASTSLSDLTEDTRKRVEALLQAAAVEGIRTRVVSTLRTCDDQNAIYAKGRTSPGSIISYAQGCRSWHVWGRAADLVVLDDNGAAVWNGADTRYDRLGEMAREIEMRWGGDFPNFRDAGHFEYHPGLSIRELCPDPARCHELVAGIPTPQVPQEAIEPTTHMRTSRSSALPIVAGLIIGGGIVVLLGGKR